MSDCTNFLRGSYPCWIAARSVISSMRIIYRCLSTQKVKGIINLVPCKTEGHESEASKMIYACDSCHFLFSRVSPVKQCPDCGKAGIRPAALVEIEEFEKRKTSDLWKE